MRGREGVRGRVRGRKGECEGKGGCEGEGEREERRV